MLSGDDMKEKTTGIYGTIKDRLLYVLTLFIVLAALALIVGYSFGSFYSIAKKDALQLGEGAVSEEAEKLNNYLLQGLDVVEVTGLNVEYMMQIGRSSEEILRYLLAESDAYKEKIESDFTGIYGVFNGEYLDGIGWVPDEDFVPQNRPWYIAAVEGAGEPTVVSPYLDAQTGSILISVCQLLSDGESVVSLDIYMDEIQEFPQTISLNGNGYGFIIDSEGLVVAHWDETQKGKNYLTDEEFAGSDMQQLTRLLLSANGSTFQTDIDGESCNVFSQVVQDDWYVVMVINTEDLFRSVKMNLVRNICLSLVIFAVVAYFCTANYKNRMRAQHYAQELAKYHRTLEDRVQKQTKKIKTQTEQMLQIQEHVIDGMATLIESRDGNTGEHVLSTKKYVSMIVRYMYEHQMHPDVINKKYVENMISASVLHDVGKIRISDTILNKPGKFTKEEYEEMKKHSQLGAETVRDIMGDNADEELVQMSCDVARYHHEKWDGTGYPEGLSETQIPLCARIMAVADVFDALVSKRVYKAPMSTEEAFNILQVESGSHFDPEIVEVFLSLREEVEEYLDEKRLAG
jgi:response regulator RpfG family c-di-GMP phosphodiesterase